MRPVHVFAVRATMLLGFNRKVHREHGAAAGVIRCGDQAAVLLNDAIGCREPEARPLADVLRRVERFEDARQRGVDARPAAHQPPRRRTRADCARSSPRDPPRGRSAACRAQTPAAATRADAAGPRGRATDRRRVAALCSGTDHPASSAGARPHAEARPCRMPRSPARNRRNDRIERGSAVGSRQSAVSSQQSGSRSESRLMAVSA